MSQNTYKLTYFDVGALGEPIRWIFHYKGIPFEDNRIAWDLPAWFTKTKAEFKNSVHQIPVLTVNGKKELCQASAITRYLAGEFDLLGETNWDKARGDEVISLVFDLFDAWRKNAFERDLARKATNKPIVDQKFRIYYAKFNSLLEEVDGDYLNGKKLTHADFWISSFVNAWNTPIKPTVPGVFFPGMENMDSSVMYYGLADEYPALKKHVEKVTSIPQIKKWIDVRPKTML